MKQTTLILLSGILILSACSFSYADNKEEMLQKASFLTKVATAVESTVRYKNPPADAVDDVLLKLSTQHDPAMLDPFTKYKLRAKGMNDHGLVLLCTADGTTRLIEDAGCTAKTDAHHWQGDEKGPCEFTLDTNEVCK